MGLLSRETFFCLFSFTASLSVEFQTRVRRWSWPRRGASTATANLKVSSRVFTTLTVIFFLSWRMIVPAVLSVVCGSPSSAH